MSRFIVPCVLLFGLGCSESEPAAPTEETPAAEQSAEEELPPAEDVPVAEDFAARAAAEVTGDNYQTALDELAAEIEAASP